MDLHLRIRKPKLFNAEKQALTTSNNVTERSIGACKQWNLKSSIGPLLRFTNDERV